MVISIYKKALGVCLKKPIRLWGISLLSSLISFLIMILFGIIPGVSLGLTLVLSVSMTMIYLRGYRGETPNTADLFYNFADGKRFLRVLGGMAWNELWIVIFALIPIAGPIIAIVKSYEYSLAPYILTLEPNVKPTEAIKVSKQRTKGFKGKMFLADLLVYVAFFVVELVLGLLAMIPFIGVLFRLVLFLVYICYIVLLPLFLGLVHAAFYEEIMKTVNGTQEAPAAE